MSTKRFVVLGLAAVLLVSAAETLALAAPEAPPVPARHVRINGHAATARDLMILQQLELRSGQRTPDGDYWYDNATGAAGNWGGPVTAFLPPGLGLGGALPANASGGGTHVFINGRELHPVDLQRLTALLGPVAPGRYWVNAQGNAGPEGGPAVVNLYQIARRAGGGGNGGGGRDWTYHSDGVGGPGGNINGASDGQTTCFTASGHTYCTDGNN